MALFLRSSLRKMEKSGESLDISFFWDLTSSEEFCLVNLASLNNRYSLPLLDEMGSCSDPSRLLRLLSIMGCLTFVNDIKDPLRSLTLELEVGLTANA